MDIQTDRQTDMRILLHKIVKLENKLDLQGTKSVRYQGLLLFLHSGYPLLINDFLLD